MNNSSPLLIGLTAGIAGGKSTVAAMLDDRGARVIDADKLAHQELARPEVVKQLVERWGRGVVDERGRPNSRAIAERVFGEGSKASAERIWLESVIHPRVRAAMDQIIAKESESGVRVFVIDVPLLVEVGWHKFCQIVLWIDTPLELRQKSATDRGWPAGELERREAAQLPGDRKRAVATHVLSNDGSLDELRTRVAEFWRNAVEPAL